MKQNLIFRILALVIILGALTSNTFAQGTGKIVGKLTDKKTGETLIGVSVKISGTTKGTSSDVEGRYTIGGLASDSYTLEFSYIGYPTKKISDIAVTTGKVTTLDIVMEESGQLLKEVVIKGTAKQESINNLYAQQKTSTRISDGITADVIRRSPDRNTGEVLKRVSGATIQENKFLTVRGLSDRYNNTLINNTSIPSSEPDRRAFSFDIIPSNLIDQIIINKTGTPDLPGEFAGGIVQLKTKDFPNQRTLEVNYSTGYNSVSTFQPHFGSKRGATDYLSFDDGFREIPASFPSSSSRFQALSTEQRISMSKQFNNTWARQEFSRTIPSQSVQAIYGNSKVFKNDSKFGGIVSLSYKNQQNQNDRERNDFFELRDGGRGDDLFAFNDQIYRNQVNIGALANLAYSFKRNKIALKNIYNRIFDDSYTDRKGIAFEYPYAQVNSEYQLTQKSLLNTILEGEHTIGTKNLKIDWNAFYNNTIQSQPDIRRIYYSKDLSAVDNPNVPYGANVASGSASPKNAGRSYLDLDENIFGGQLNYTHPFKLGKTSQSFKVGVLKQFKDRTFNARLLGYVITDPTQFNLAKLNLPQDEIFSDVNLSVNGFRIDDITDPNGQYEATGDLTAGYLMLNNEVLKDFKITWGVRVENYLEQLNLIGSKVRVTDNNYLDILPSANLTYSLNPKTNLRASYSRTVARAEFRELAPFSFYNFRDGLVDQGNADLKRTQINNFDLRAEYYPSSGQILSASVFYKTLDKPIEFVFGAGSTSLSKSRRYENAPSATILGFEVEARENLGFLGEAAFFKGLTAYANFTLLKSEVNFDDVANAEPSRALQGQSPYIINGGLQYVESEGSYSVNLLYNRIGPRINTVGFGNNSSGSFTIDYPNILENPRDVLDLQLAKRIFKGKADLKLNIGDILNQRAILFQDLNNEKKYNKGTDQTIESINAGTTFTILLSYRL